MEEILKQIENKLVEQRNTVKYQLSTMVENAIKGSTKVDTCLFLKALNFNFNIVESVEIHQRINKGESFTNIVNDITNKKLSKKQ